MPSRLLVLIHKEFYILQFHILQKQNKKQRNKNKTEFIRQVENLWKMELLAEMVHGVSIFSRFTKNLCSAFYCVYREHVKISAI